MIREAIADHTGNALPELPAPPPARAYGSVELNESAVLIEALSALYPGDGIPSFKPATMESYGQPCVLHLVPAAADIPLFCAPGDPCGCCMTRWCQGPFLCPTHAKHCVFYLTTGMA